MRSAHSELLEVRGLCIRDAAGRPLVDDLDLAVRAGETVALVGESGSGKSLTAKAIMGLLPTGLSATGQICLDDEDLITASSGRMRQLRGSHVGLLLQDPFTTLNPLLRIRKTMEETISSNRRSWWARGKTRIELTREVSRRLRDVGLDPGIADMYPWELSGGMRQRVGLAATVAKDPALLIADEPTTALDATTQREVLLLLKQVQQERHMGLLLITHDLRVAFSLSDRILVMSEGRLLEQADPDTLRRAPKTDYTRKLLAAELPITHRRTDLSWGAPASAGAVTPLSSESVEPDALVPPLLTVEGLAKRFDAPRGKGAPDRGWALKGVDLELRDGASLGIIGESGSGKTTLARCLLGLEEPTSGTMHVNQHRFARFADLSGPDKASVRRTMQCVFQDPYSSLNPSHSVGFILREAMVLRGGTTPTDAEVAEETRVLLADVDLPPDVAKRRPGTLSGGQRQRVAIARALAMRPKVLVCDEPVAALDASVQAQVLEVLRKIQADGINLVFITHDLPVVRQMTDEIAVLYRGDIVERGLTSDVLDNPQHDYTKRLLAAIPTGKGDWLSDASRDGHPRPAQANVPRGVAARP